jgi:hypothetical protein
MPWRSVASLERLQINSVQLASYYYAPLALWYLDYSTHPPSLFLGFNCYEVLRSNNRDPVQFGKSISGLAHTLWYEDRSR